MTREQINWIAGLSPDTEFFFRSPFGETIVVAVLAGGRVEEMGEDGMVMRRSSSNASDEWSTARLATIYR